jgi:hypothetical protein
MYYLDIPTGQHCAAKPLSFSQFALLAALYLSRNTDPRVHTRGY